MPHTNNKEAKIYELVEKHGLNHSEPDVVALSEAIDWGAERERERICRRLKSELEMKLQYTDDGCSQDECDEANWFNKGIKTALEVIQDNKD